MIIIVVVIMLITIEWCAQASGLVGKASIAMMAYDVQHAGSHGKMTLAEGAE
jgi:hypothetical protein